MRIRTQKSILFSAMMMALFSITLISGCKKEDSTTETCTDGIKNQNETGVDCGGSCVACICPPGYTGADCSQRIFTTEDDKAFGLQMETEIAAHPLAFPLLPSSHAAYYYLNTIKQDILDAGQVEDSAHYAWKIYIVINDSVLNAFCTPGGHIYIYTGLLKYLESASTLTGVMAHEMAHVDKRHTTQLLATQYGLALMVKVVAGTASVAEVAEIAGALPTLPYPRNLEREADEYSVKYLCPTKYYAEGSSFLFQKLENYGIECSSMEHFFATHPCPDNRITRIQSDAVNQNCAVNNNISNSEDIAAYNAFKASLP